MLKSAWLKVIARYILVPGLALGLSTLVASILRATFPGADIGFMAFILPPAAVLIAWVAVVVSDRRRQAWRLWGPWAPCAPILLLLLVSLQRPRAVWDDAGFDLLLYGEILQMAAVLAMIGSVVAWVWRPGSRRPQPVQ